MYLLLIYNNGGIRAKKWDKSAENSRMLGIYVYKTDSASACKTTSWIHQLDGFLLQTDITSLIPFTVLRGNTSLLRIKLIMLLLAVLPWVCLCLCDTLRAFVGQPMWKVVATSALLPPWRLLSRQCSDQLLVTVPFLSLHRGHGTAYTTCHPNCFILHLLLATTEDTSV